MSALNDLAATMNNKSFLYRLEKVKLATNEWWLKVLGHGPALKEEEEE